MEIRFLILTEDETYGTFESYEKAETWAQEYGLVTAAVDYEIVEDDR